MSRSVIKTTSEIDSEPSILIRSQENSWPPFKLQCLFVLKLLETFPILSFCYRKKKNMVRHRDQSVKDHSLTIWMQT